MVVRHLEIEEDPACVKRALKIVSRSRGLGEALLAGVSEEAGPKLWSLLMSLVREGRSPSLQGLALNLLGDLIQESRQPPREAPEEAVRTSVSLNAWVDTLLEAVEPSQPTVVREAAARSIAAAQVLTSRELSAGMEEEEDASMLLGVWSATINLLQDDDEEVRYRMAISVMERGSQGGSSHQRKTPGKGKDFSPYLVVKAFWRAHSDMSSCLWRRPAYAAYLAGLLEEHSILGLEAAVSADPAITRRVFEKERENSHKEDLLSVQGAAHELSKVLAWHQGESLRSGLGGVRVEALERAKATLKKGLGFLRRYCTSKETMERPLDQLEAGEVTYRTSKVTFLAIYTLLLHAEAVGLTADGVDTEGLVAKVASFDPRVHELLSDFVAHLSNPASKFEPHFLLLGANSE